MTRERSVDRIRLVTRWDSERQVSGYPRQPMSQAAFVESEWNLDTMEPLSGRYPGQKGPVQENQSARDRACSRSGVASQRL